MSTDRGICKESYGVGFVPGRKRVALYRACGVNVTVLSYFNNEAEARAFMQFVDRLARYDTKVVDDEWHGWAEVVK